MINNVNAYVIIQAGIDIILKHLAYVPFFLALSYSLLSSNFLDYEINEHIWVHVSINTLNINMYMYIIHVYIYMYRWCITNGRWLN